MLMHCMLYNFRLYKLKSAFCWLQRDNPSCPKSVPCHNSDPKRGERQTSYKCITLLWDPAVCVSVFIVYEIYIKCKKRKSTKVQKDKNTNSKACTVLLWHPAVQVSVFVVTQVLLAHHAQGQGLRPAQRRTSSMEIPKCHSLFKSSFGVNVDDIHRCPPWESQMIDMSEVQTRALAVIRRLIDSQGKSSQQHKLSDILRERKNNRMLYRQTPAQL